jgi:hypothetical protein
MDKPVADNSADVFTVFAAEYPIPYEMTNLRPRWRKDVVAPTGQRTPVLRPEVRHRHSPQINPLTLPYDVCLLYHRKLVGAGAQLAAAAATAWLWQRDGKNR